MNGIIKVRNLIKVYKTKKVRFRALKGIDLDIGAGSFTAIVGTSGSGKSTLLNLMAGLERPTAGEIWVDGNPVHKMSEDQLVDFRLAHVGFVFQNFNLMDTLTTLENAAFPLILKNVSKRERDQKATGLLERVGLSGHLEHDPDELSGGQQQRVAIARALITEPEIIFADEPTGNLDSQTAEQIMELLYGAVRDGGATLVMVTHDIEKAKYADQIIHLCDGEIVEEMETTKDKG